MRKSDVSVIIPTYNSVNTIERAIQSVAKQTMLPREIIIVDDCSSNPKIKSLLDKIQKDYNRYFDVIKIIYLEKNCGPGTARNIGMDKASYEYIAFLDSDDIWHPQKLEIQYSYMQKYKDVYFAAHNGIIIKNNDLLNQFTNKQYDKDDIKIKNINAYKYLFKHYMQNSNTSSVMLKNDKNLQFYDNKRYFEDYLLWLEYNFTHKGILLNLPLSASFKANYGDSGLSADLWKMEKGELETFKILQEKGYIGICLKYIASCFSLLKFIRRCIVTYVRKSF